MRRLYIGCGLDQPEGWINLDKADFGQEVIRDIERGLPFDDNSIDEIRCHHTLEHIHDLPFVMSEIWRVLAPGGVIDIEVPAWDDAWAVETFTHCRSFTLYSFDQLCGYEDNPQRETLIRYREAEGFHCRFRLIEGQERIDPASGCREIHVVLEAVKSC